MIQGKLSALVAVPPPAVSADTDMIRLLCVYSQCPITRKRQQLSSAPERSGARRCRPSIFWGPDQSTILRGRRIADVGVTKARPFSHDRRGISRLALRQRTKI